MSEESCLLNHEDSETKRQPEGYEVHTDSTIGAQVPERGRDEAHDGEQEEDEEENVHEGSP